MTTTTLARLAPLNKLPRCPIFDRNKFILDYCRGMQVLHLGCAAWPETERLYHAQELVHCQIDGVCEKLGGIDIAAEGVQFLRDQGLRDLYLTDLRDPSRLRDILSQLGWQPDILLAGLFLEHLDAPGLALQGIAANMDRTTRLVLTSPNALALKSVMRGFLGIEKVPNDLLAYYSYATMQQLLSRHGLEIARIGCYRAHTKYKAESIFNRLIYPLMYLRPHLTDGLIVVARRSDDFGARPGGENSPPNDSAHETSCVAV